MAEGLQKNYAKLHSSSAALQQIAYRKHCSILFQIIRPLAIIEENASAYVNQLTKVFLGDE